MKVNRKSFVEIIGLLRTYLISYFVPGKQRRLQNLYRLFIGKDDLCFDIGAHFGNRTAVWRKLGANVIAIEPQPKLYAFLQKKHAVDPRVTLLQAAVSDKAGTLTLYHNTRNPSISSIDKSWVQEKKQDAEWGKFVWDEEIEVQAYTLDQLIETYGTPAFCKIDVEGAEHKVLAGLSTPIQCVSFEYLTIDRERALRCVEHLESLGTYKYNWTVSEQSKLKSSTWLSAHEIKITLEGMRDERFSGDVYARLAR
jgi:FkbM family methyltransferase